MSTISEALRTLKLNEDINDIYQEYYSDIDRETFDKLLEADPTGDSTRLGSYAKWIISLYKKDNTIIDKLNKIKELLDSFNSSLKTIKASGLSTDINQIKSIEELEQIVQNSANKHDLRATMEANGEIPNHVQFICSGTRYDVYHPLDYHGNNAITHKGAYMPNVSYSDGKSFLIWCTGSGESHFDSYGRDYYCFIDKDNYVNNSSTCYQIAKAPSANTISQWRDGGNNGVGGGDHNAPNPEAKDKFMDFLLANPELTYQLKDTILYSKFVEIQEVLDVLDAQKGIDYIYKGELFLKGSKYLRPLLKKVTIEEGTTTIKPQVFTKCVSIESVQVPSSVKSIETGAFRGCTSLKNLELSEGLERIEKLAFFNCKDLGRVDIPNSVTYLSINAFKDCPDVSLRIINTKDRYIDIGIPFENLNEDDYRWIKNHMNVINEQPVAVQKSVADKEAEKAEKELKKQAFSSMTPEEKEAFKKMSGEEKAAFIQKRVEELKASK